MATTPILRSPAMRMVGVSSMKKRTREKVALLVFALLVVLGGSVLLRYFETGRSWNVAASVDDDRLEPLDSGQARQTGHEADERLGPGVRQLATHFLQLLLGGIPRPSGPRSLRAWGPWCSPSSRGCRCPCESELLTDRKQRGPPGANSGGERNQREA